jgi:hypothetical protein
MAFALAGCVLPEVRNSIKSPAIYGRVLDATTKAPIQGATIAFVEKPSINCQTGADGAFAIDATHNVHFLMLLGPCGADWPEGHYYTTWKISKAGYQERTMDIYQGELREKDKNDEKLHLKDVLLVPTKSEPNQPAQPTPGS